MQIAAEGIAHKAAKNTKNGSVQFGVLIAENWNTYKTDAADIKDFREEPDDSILKAQLD